jgi:hypothetical protein
LPWLFSGQGAKFPSTFSVRPQHSSIALTSVLIWKFAGGIPPYIYADIGGVDRWIWFILAYLIALAGICPFVGSLSDLIGRRYVALIGSMLILVGVIVSSTAHRMNTFIGELETVFPALNLCLLSRLQLGRVESTQTVSHRAAVRPAIRHQNVQLFHVCRLNRHTDSWLTWIYSWYDPCRRWRWRCGAHCPCRHLRIGPYPQARQIRCGPCLYYHSFLPFCPLGSVDCLTRRLEILRCARGCMERCGVLWHPVLLLPTPSPQLPRPHAEAGHCGD